MKIDLTQFEQQIDPTILKRGLQYYKKGMVDILSESSDMVEAHVEGSDGEPYSTVLHLDGDTVTDSVCSCPYDFGPVCKHVAAVIFAMQAEELNIAVKPKTERKKPTKTKAQKASDKVQELLQNASPEQLASFIEDICKDYREIRQLLIAKLTPKSQTQSMSDYKSSLSAYAQSLKRRGFIDYRSANLLGNALYETCATAEERLSVGDYISAVNAATAVIEQANSALQYTDDSNGCIGGPIDSATETLAKVAESKLDEKSRKHLLKYCLTSYKKEIFEGWDWHDSMLELAVKVVKEKKEIEEVRLLLEAEIKNAKREWQADSSKELMAEFIDKTDGEDAMNKYKSQNLDVSSFRAEAVESAIQKTEYATAKKLVNEAIKLKIGNSGKWQNFQFRLENLTGTTDDVIRLSRQLVVDSYREYEEYYRRLKSLVAPEEWVSFRTELYNDILKKNNGWERVRAIAVWEQDWETYMKWVERSNNYYTLSTAESELPSTYNAQLVQQYVRIIRANMGNSYNLNRKEYQRTTQAMRRMKKLGGLSEVVALADELRAQYPNRPALLEELNMI